MAMDTAINFDTTTDTTGSTKWTPDELLKHFGEDSEWGADLDPHPDPNEENYDGMIYVGRHEHHHHLHHEDDNHVQQRPRGRRLSADYDNHVKYIFGTSFDETHKEIELRDLAHHDDISAIWHDIANRAHLQQTTHEEILKERRHNKVGGGNNYDSSQQDQQQQRKEPIQPKPYGYVDTHPLDGGVMPPKVVSVEPFFLDESPVTNAQFAKFVRSTYYETEAEKYGWSFVLVSFVPGGSARDHHGGELESDPEAEHWVVVDGAYWRQPEGPKSSYKYREHHPVVHVSHRDAAEYCTWVGKRLPGEWEYEAAARAGHYAPSNRTLYPWGDEDDWTIASKHANLWGGKTFPYENDALDGWRGTSPVRNYPANPLGFYDMVGNVWEWMRGGKHKARIVRGGSYVDSLDGSSNHAATCGARSVIHATTTTGNVGFRCAKSPKRRIEHHYTYHDESIHGPLAIEDQFGRRNTVPMRGWEDQYVDQDDDDDDDNDVHDVDDDEVKQNKRKLKKKKVVKRRERLSTEL